MTVNKSEIESLLHKHFRPVSSKKAWKSFNIGQDGAIDVVGDVVVFAKMDRFPVTFGTITGSFDCSLRGLTSLVGAPHTVTKDFLCNDNKLKDLVGAPRTVGGKFDCSGNFITELASGPDVVKGTYACANNRLTDFTGLPAGFNDILLGSNQNGKLKSISGITATSMRGFDISMNSSLESLKGLPRTTESGLWLPDGPNVPYLRAVIGDYPRIVIQDDSGKENKDMSQLLTDYNRLHKDAGYRAVLALQRYLMKSGLVGNARG